MQVTIITPIAPHHEHLFVRCADSVRKQTIECRHLHMVDTEMRGPGYIRNLLLKQVKTKFVVFLDADDYLEPDFVYECLKASTPDRYVFTDWYQGSLVCSQQKGKFWETALHLITCLIHTDMMQIVGGFDEKLEAMEDTDLFLKFDQYAYCGTKVALPLAHYTNQGKRGGDAHKNNIIRGIKIELAERYRGVGCCSGADNSKLARPPVGVRAPGDVQVVALWAGNKVTGGAYTGRRYQRASRPMRLWVDPQDAMLRPDLYRILPAPTTVKEPKKAVRQRVKKPRTFADMLMAAGVLEIAIDAPLPVAATSIKPDYAKLNEIAQRIFNVQRDTKPGTNRNSKAVITKPKRAKRVRKPSAARSDTPGRELVAIGDR